MQFDVDVSSRNAPCVGTHASTSYLRAALEPALHVATVLRVPQAALADYQGVPALEEALFILIQSYDALGMTQLRDDASRVMEASYPQGVYATGSVKTKSNPWWKFW